MAIIEDIKKEWIKETEKPISDPQARRALFESISRKLDHNQDLEDINNRFRNAFQKDLYETIFEEDYYSRHPSERPAQDNAHTAYQMGKFHQIISNSLHTLEAYAQGFIGCLIGGLFIGTGMMLGTLIRGALDLQRDQNQKSLEPEEVEEMKRYLILKISQVFGDEVCENIAFSQILGFKFENLELEEDTIGFIADYEAQNEHWIPLFQDRMQAHLRENGESAESAKLFTISCALAMEFIEKRDLFCSEENIHKGAQQLQAFVMKIIGQIENKDLQNSLIHLFEINQNSLEEASEEDPDSRFKEILLSNNEINGLIKKEHFTPMYNQYVAMRKYQELKAHPFSAMGQICQKAMYEGAYIMMAVYYDYLMGAQQQPDQNSQARRNHMLMNGKQPQPNRQSIKI